VIPGGEEGRLRWAITRLRRENEKNTSEVTLADAQGKPRIRMTVESAGQPTLEFLDKDGKIVYSLPPGGGK
jgi:hypothetical protein